MRALITTNASNHTTRTASNGLDRGADARRNTSWLLATSATAAFLAFGSNAFAADADADAGTAAADNRASTAGEILVTAQRHETRIQDTPLAVNAIGASELQDRAFRRLSDLAGLAAGVNIPNQGGGTQAVFIRGIGTNRPIGNPSVGVYIDDIYIPRSFGTGWYGSLPDIERVEILHGPQGTLYGQNSSAGALKFISALPGQQTKLTAEAGYGNFDAFDARLYAAGPLSDDFSASIAATHTRRDGIDDNPTLGRKVGALATDAVRGILRFNRGTTDIILSADYLRDRSDYRAASPTNLPGSGRRRTFSEIDPQQRFDAGGVTLRISQELSDALTLKSITGYRKFHTFMPTDSDGKVGYISGFNQDLHQKQISEEVQLIGDFDRLKFTIGGLAYQEHFDIYRLSWSNGAFSVIDTQNRNTVFGAYAQGDYKLTDALTATLGLRLSYERNEMDALGYRSTITGTRGATTFDIDGLKKSFTTLVPRLGLNYRFSPHLLAYVTFAQGRTSGGWNIAPGNDRVARIPIGQEKVTSYEAGLKASSADNKFQGSLTAFYNDYADYQASITNPVIDGQVVTGSVIQNAGDAHIYGLEFELTARPDDRFSAQLSFAYLRSAFDTYSNPSGAESTNYVGQDLPFAPKFSGGLTLGYKIPLRNDGNVRLLASARHETSSYSTVTPTREQNKFPRQTFVDATLSFTLPGNHWTLAIEGKNLFNKAYVLPISGAWAPAQGLYGVGYSIPRTVMGRIRYSL